MIAIGCLAPLILGVAGGLGGHWLAGNEGMLWGGAGGLIFGGLILAAISQIVGQLKS